MWADIIAYLEKISPEEEGIVNERKSPLPVFGRRADGSFELEEGDVAPRLIKVLKQPRFVPIPNHEHSYLEMVYMCRGSTRHVLNQDEEIILQEGELLFIKPGVSHVIDAAAYHDLAVHFLVMPEFLNYPLSRLYEDTVLRDFMQKSVNGDQSGPGYLHYHVEDMPEVQNLLENMTRSLLSRHRNSRQILQATLGILFLELAGRTYSVTVSAPPAYERQLVLDAMSYIELHYKTASLADFCARCGQQDYYVSRIMKRYSPYTFTKYLQRRRLLQAAHLLSESSLPIEQIIVDVGYENSSHFHKLFKRVYGMTPKAYRAKYSGMQADGQERRYSPFI